jgi:hypothetical protein
MRLFKMRSNGTGVRHQGGLRMRRFVEIGLHPAPLQSGID